MNAGVKTSLDVLEPSTTKRKKENPGYVQAPPPEKETDDVLRPPSDLTEVTTGADGEIGEAGLVDDALKPNAEQEEQRASEPAPNFKELPPEGYPEPDERPCYRLYLNAFTIGERFLPAGVYNHFMAGKGEEKYPVDACLCAPLVIRAKTANKEDADYGRLLEFQSSNGLEKKWSMPMSLLAGDGVELLERLYNDGLDINYPHRKKIADYISSEQPKAFLHCATRTGWHSADTFVLPECVIGNQDIWFQSHTRVAAYATAGEFQKWQTVIAERAIGNPFLFFAISFGLSGPLLLRLNLPGSGVHFYGDSSAGKTSVLEAAASCWGNGQGIQAQLACNG